jgi:hypothetical protein
MANKHLKHHFWVMNQMVTISVAILIIFSGCGESRTQSKVARDRASLRAIANALEAYYIWWNIYPSNLSLLTHKAVFNPPVMWLGGKQVSEIGPFIEKIPFSAFGKDIYPRNFTPSDMFWIVWYPGPDERYDLNLSDRYDDVNKWVGTRKETPSFIINYTYDPTNGTLSKGDIVRWKM